MEEYLWNETVFFSNSHLKWFMTFVWSYLHRESACSANMQSSPSLRQSSCKAKAHIYKILDCEYGGVCKETEIKSKTNFWGETVTVRGTNTTDDKVEMHICPPKYCCQDVSCSPYWTCAENRSVLKATLQFFENLTFFS